MGMMKNWLVRHCYDPSQKWWADTIRAKARFMCNGIAYQYESSAYNFSYANERSVEIPIFKHSIKKAPKGARILEVGNVLSHYIETKHIVVDKYEKSPKVLNQDIVDYQPHRTFDLIISISTLEHIGWDEPIKDPQKIITALKHLQRLLAAGGEMKVSFPLGYNPNLDRLVKGKMLPFTQVIYMQRVSGFTNKWVEVPTCPTNPRYGEPFNHANVIAICSTTKIAKV